MQFESTEKRTSNQKSGTKNHMISRLEISAKGDNSQLNKTNYALTIIYDKAQSMSRSGLDEN